jgi:serine/threonine protein kinase/CheY-like chemotaxis protein
LRRLGRYALLHRLSSGDHSELFIARLDDRLPGGELAVGEACACEMPRPDIASDMEYARLLLAEGAAACRIRHKNIAKLFEVERTGPDLYSAGEHVIGQTLASVLQRGSAGGAAIEKDLLLWIGAEIAAGLQAAHQKAWSPSSAGPMVHGGLSPRSVMLTYEGEVKLLGMGSGHARLHLPPPRSRLHYAAPEVIARRTADRRTDVFALGVVLYDALTGQRLFRRATEVETRAAILEGEPIQAKKELESLGDSAATMIERMLARSPDRRPKDLEEVEATFREALGARQETAGTRLQQHLGSAFRDEREGQRRVIDAALRRVTGSGARSQSTPLPRLPIVEAERPLEEVLPELVQEVNDPIQPEDRETEAPGAADAVPTLDLPSVRPIPLVRRSSKPTARAIVSEADPMPILPMASSALAPSPAPSAVASDSDRTVEIAETAVKDWLEPERRVPLDRDATTPGGPPLMLEDTGLTVADGDSSLEAAIDAAPSDPDELVGPGVEQANFGAARYRRSELIGVSEVASVFRATDAILGRKVALKISEIGEEDKSRFDRATRNRALRREARIAAGLAHPRISFLLDAGRDGDLYFLAYQLVEGESLDGLLARSGTQAPRAAAKLLHDIAEALAYMHGAGWLHGDIQPANIIVEPDGRARLIDFSMARSERQKEHPIPLSRSAETTPEVLAGGPYDLGAEQFAFGALGYRMLTGEAPFTGDAEVLRAAHQKRPKAPAEIDGSIDARLSELIMQLIDPDPAKRHPSMSKVLAELARIIDAPRVLPRTRSAAEGAFTGDIAPDRIATHLEQALLRLDTSKPVDETALRDVVLARSVSKKLGLRPDLEALIGLTSAARGLVARSGGSAAVLEGLVPGPVIERVRNAGRASLDSGPLDIVVEVIRVVEAYGLAIKPQEDGRRVSPRKAVLKLRERADEGRFDTRVVEGLIDHLRDVISALEVPSREVATRRLLIAELYKNAALHDLLQNQGFVLEVATDGDEAWNRLLAGMFDGAIVDRALPKPRGAQLLHRILDDARTKDLPLVILSASMDDTIDELINTRGSVDVVARTAPAEQIVRVLHLRLRA